MKVFAEWDFGGEQNPHLCEYQAQGIDIPSAMEAQEKGNPDHRSPPKTPPGLLNPFTWTQYCLDLNLA